MYGQIQKKLCKKIFGNAHLMKYLLQQIFLLSHLSYFVTKNLARMLINEETLNWRIISYMRQIDFSV